MVLPPCLFARLFSALMEELMVHCSCSDPDPPHFLFHWLPATHSGLSQFGRGPARPGSALECVSTLLCLPSVRLPAHLPSNACLCGRLTARTFLFGRWCVLFLWLWFQCFHSSGPNPSAHQPRAETQRFTSGFAQYSLEFVFFKFYYLNYLYVCVCFGCPFLFKTIFNLLPFILGM